MKRATFIAIAILAIAAIPRWATAQGGETTIPGATNTVGGTDNTAADTDATTDDTTTAQDDGTVGNDNRRARIARLIALQQSIKANNALQQQRAANNAVIANSLRQRQFGANNPGFGQFPNILQSDRRFLVAAAAANLREILLGTLAVTNSSTPEVQAFGAQLIQDHSAALEEITQLAENLGIDVPTNDTPANLRDARRFENLTGTRFDVAFINDNIRGHLRNIQLHASEAQRGREADVRAFARSQLPVLTEHLVTALEIQESLRETQNTQDNTLQRRRIAARFFR